MKLALKIKRVALLLLVLVLATQVVSPSALIAATEDDLAGEDLSSITYGTPLYSKFDLCSGTQTPTPNFTLTDDEKLAQRMFVGAYDATSATDIVKQYNVGGLFMAKNDSRVSEDYLKAVNTIKTSAKTPLYVATDQEPTSTVDSLGLFAGKKASDMTDENQAKAGGNLAGDALAKYGINMDFAPVVDIAVPGNFLTNQGRTLSSDPEQVAKLARAFSMGLQEKKVMPVIKHFPGHGHSNGDSHTTSPSTPSLDELKKSDLIPYAKLKDMDNTAVMVGHLTVPGFSTAGLPTSIDPKTYELLRGAGSDYATKGIIISDELHMQAVLSASNNDISTAVINTLKAGADMALFNVKDKAEFDGIFTKVKAAIGKDATILAQADQVAKSKTSFLQNPGAPSPTPGGGGSLAGADNTEKVFRWLLGKGLTAVQSAAVIGNLLWESGLIPNNQQNSSSWSNNQPNGASGGWGLAQWTNWGVPSNKDRRWAIWDEVNNAGLLNLYTNDNDPSTPKLTPEENDKLLIVELNYLWKESETIRKGAFEKLRTQTDVQQATIDFQTDFEQSHDTLDEVIKNRVTPAKKALELYGNSAPSTGGPSTGSGCSSGSGGNGDSPSPWTGGAVPNARMMDDGFAVFMQCDPTWGDTSGPVCQSDCGPFSMAMIIQNLGVNVQPLDVVKFAIEIGAKTETSGTDPSVLVPKAAEKWGLRAEPIPLSAAKSGTGVADVLRKGGLVMVSGQGGNPYTSGGHFVVIRKVLDNGRYLIGDPNSYGGRKANNTIEWDPTSELFTSMHNQPYAVYKK